jgi:hypothetical protein
MPRPLSVSPSEILKAAINFELLEGDGERKKLYPPSNHVWTDISAKLDWKLKSSKHVWLMFHNNRHDIKSKYLLAKGKSQKDNVSNVKIPVSEYSDNKNKKCAMLSASITLSAKEWSKLKPIRIMYQDKRDGVRGYKKLKGGWADIIRKAIWDQVHIPCPFIFKKATISDSEHCPYLQIRGICKECNVKILAHTALKPREGSEITLQIRTDNTQDIPHIKRESICGQFDILSSLQNIMASPEFVGVIKEVCLYKFRIIYWTQSQLSSSIDIAKRDGTLLLSATGSLVRRVQLFHEPSGHIFLYQGVMVWKNSIVPVLQMLSDENNANTIRFG